MRTKRMLLVLLLLSLTAWPLAAHAAPPPPGLPGLDIRLNPADSPQEVVGSLQILFLLTVLTLAPSILVLMTSFTRIIVVLSFVRSALSTQQMPPNQVLIGLALFLTFFVMAPTAAAINSQALQPYLAGQIDQQTALRQAEAPLRDFMFRQTREKDLALFVRYSKLPAPKSPADIPTYILIPSFVISELRTAFQIGFMIFVPFLIIDMVVASTLMSMGMMMLPPVMISLPFKILLFVMVDGWNLVIRALLASFH